MHLFLGWCLMNHLFKVPPESCFFSLSSWLCSGLAQRSWCEKVNSRIYKNAVFVERSRYRKWYTHTNLWKSVFSLQHLEKKLLELPILCWYQCHSKSGKCALLTRDATRWRRVYEVRALASCKCSRTTCCIYTCCDLFVFHASYFLSSAIPFVWKQLKPGSLWLTYSFLKL